MNSNKLPIVLLNGTVVTTNGVYRISDIDIESARKLLLSNTYVSAIGHEATAHLMTDLLGMKIDFNRIQISQEVSQLAIVFKLNIRPVEGIILSMDEIQNIGYSLKLMERIE